MTKRRDIIRLLLLMIISALLLFVAYEKLRSGIPAELMTALRQGEKFELLSLDPELAAIKEARTGEEFSNKCRGWIVLGSTLIDDDSIRKRLIGTLDAGAKENRTAAAGCFNPRHAIRVVRQGKVIDFVICFECLQVLVYEGEDKDHTQYFLVSQTPQSVFDDVLKNAGIPLSARPE